MKSPLPLLLALLVIPISTAFAQGPRGKNNQPLPLQGKDLPDVAAFDSEGKPFDLHQKLKGRHAVIVFGCLTWPPFLKNVPGLEAVHHDYKSRGVDFYYVYKSLAHPEKDGYVQPVMLEERLAHIAAAEAKLDTRIPWLADSMDNDLKHAFGDRNNSEFVVSPQGKLVIARSWSNPEQLREDLAELVGESETLTEIADLDLNPKAATKLKGSVEIASGVVPRVDRAQGASALVVTPVQAPVAGQEDEGSAPLYVKLRAEAPRALLDGGEGKLYLGFHIDPIYQMHWNNLAPALDYEITTAEGVKIAQATGTGPKVEEADADRDPREFLIDVDFGDASPSAHPLTVQVNYFACDDAGTFCKAASQTFTVEWRVDRDAGKVREAGAGTGGRPGNSSSSRRDPSQLIKRMDRDDDGKVSRAEAAGPMIQRFDHLDADEDGFVTEAEMKKGFETMRRR